MKFPIAVDTVASVTEEDTFRALKKWSKQELLQAVHEQDRRIGPVSGAVRRRDLLDKAGWTYNEYLYARYSYREPLDE